MMMKFRLILLALCAVASLASAEPVLMEGVAAVVDGKPIMRSEYLSSLYRYQETPEGSAMSEADQRKYVLDQLIEEKVLLSRIDRDSIVVSDAEVDQRVTAHFSSWLLARTPTWPLWKRQSVPSWGLAWLSTATSWPSRFVAISK